MGYGDAMAPGIIETGIRRSLTAEQYHKWQKWIPALWAGTCEEVAGIAAS